MVGERRRHPEQSPPALLQRLRGQGAHASVRPLERLELLNVGLRDPLRAAKERQQSRPAIRGLHRVPHAVSNAIPAQEVEEVGRRLPVFDAERGLDRVRDVPQGRRSLRNLPPGHVTDPWSYRGWWCGGCPWAARFERSTSATGSALDPESRPSARPRAPPAAARQDQPGQSPRACRKRRGTPASSGNPRSARHHLRSPSA